MTTPAEPRDVSSRRVLLIRTAPAVVEPEGRGLRFSGPGFQGLRTPGSAPWFDGHTPPGPVGPSSDREIGRLTNASWNQRAGGIAGTLSIFPAGVTSAADRQRGLIPSGSDRLSIRYYPIGENAEIRGVDGAVDVLSWGISHVASVGEPADVSAGNELGSAAGYDLEVALHWIDDSEVEMTQPTIDLASILPQLSDAIAAGVRQGNAATDTEGPAAADQMSVMLKIAASQPELYKPGMLQDLALDLAMGQITTAKDFRDKLTSIQIVSRPQSPGISDAEVSQYDLNGVVRGIMSGDLSGVSKEMSRSAEIKRHSDLKGIFSPDAIAIPIRELTSHSRELASHSGTTGAGASGTAVEEIMGAAYDSGTPDSTDVVSMMTQLSNEAGYTKNVSITVPQPSHVSEPLDAGYSKTGDSTGVGENMVPSLLVDYMSLTRVLSVWNPDSRATCST